MVIYQQFLVTQVEVQSHLFLKKQKQICIGTIIFIQTYHLFLNS